MADNTVLNVGAGGDAMRDKDRAGVKTPIVGLDLGIGTGTEVLMVGAMPASQSGIWNVGVTGSVAVTGTFWQATQPISGTVAATQSGAWTFTIAAGAAVIGHVIVDSGTVSITGSVAVTGTFWQATQPVSGTVAATQSGTWNIGTVTTVTTVGAVTAITNPLPAGTNLLGQVAASDETSTIYNGATALTPLFAVINASASGANTIVTATGGKRIRVLRYAMSSNGAVNAKFQTSTGPTDLTGLEYLTQFARGGGAYCPVGLFQTGVGDSLILNLSAAIAVGGCLTYVLV